MDLRGHGDSDWPSERAYEHEDFARDVVALCESDEIASATKRPIVIGASLGGMSSMIAQAFVDTQLYRGIALVDIAPDVDMEGGKRIMNFMLGSADGFTDLEEAAQKIGAYRGGERQPSKQGLERVLRLKEDGRWYWHWDPRMLDNRRRWINDADAAAAYSEKIRTSMVAGGSRIEVPILLVRGGSSDVVSAEAARKMLSYFPEARFVDVADASHMVAGDANDAFSEAILGFVNDVRNGEL